MLVKMTFGDSMKIIFRGLSRQIYSHERETSLTWKNANEASGLLFRLGLSGDFSIDLDFKVEELEQWMTKYLESDPAGALRLASRIQAEAICALANTNKTEK